MRKTTVHRHIRKTKKGKTIVKKHPRKIGSSWKGEKYIHGPRKHAPSKYSEFRLGKPTKEGKRLVFGKVKGKDKWEVQSELTPKNKGAGLPPGIVNQLKYGNEEPAISYLVSKGYDYDPELKEFVNSKTGKRWNRKANYNAFDGAGLGDIMNEIARREKLNKEIEKKSKELDKYSDGHDPVRQQQIVDEIRLLKKRRDI